MALDAMNVWGPKVSEPPSRFGLAFGLTSQSSTEDCMQRFVEFCTKLKIVATEVVGVLMFLSLLGAGAYLELSHLLGLVHR